MNNSNPTIDNDLQKAIDDITKNTNSDPIFADPVAAPAPINGPANLPMPPAMPAPQPLPRPLVSAPMNQSGQPNRPTGQSTNQSFSRPNPNQAPASNAAPRNNSPRPALLNQAPARPQMTGRPQPTNNSRPTNPANNYSNNNYSNDSVQFSEPTTTYNRQTSSPSDIQNIRNAALRDLAKVIDKLDVTPSEKFNVYREVHSNFGDDSVLVPAYQAASEMSDDRERGEALLYLVKAFGGDK